MVDIHCHIVPGVDDGAKDLDMALAMIEEAASVGVTAILTTPHIKAYPSERAQHDLHTKAFATLKEQVQKNIPHVALHLGGEVRVTAEGIAIVDDPYFTANEAGKFILLEMPFEEVPPYFTQTLFEYRLRGITPIVAHPERNMGVLRKPQWVLEFIRMGAHLQVTTSAVVGDLGPTYQEFAVALLKAGVVSFLASDAHNVTSRSFTSWKPACEILEDIAKEAETEYNHKKANLINRSHHLVPNLERISHLNPLAVCENGDLPPLDLTPEDEHFAEGIFLNMPSPEIQKRKRFFFF